MFTQDCTPFAVHYEKVRRHLLETATNSAKIRTLWYKNHIKVKFAHKSDSITIQ